MTRKNSFLFVAYYSFPLLQSAFSVLQGNDFNFNEFTKNKSTLKASFKFIPPELEVQFLHLKINSLSIGTQLSPEFANLFDLLGGILLHLAVEGNDLNLMENLIDFKADLNTEDRFGITPLYKAMKMNNDDMIELLVDAGASINFVSSKGYSLIHTAVIRGENEVLKKLLSKMPKTVGLNKDNVAALYKAAEVGNQEAIDILLDSNVKINFKENLFQSLLIKAVSKGRVGIVKQLIRLGEKGNFVEYSEIPLYAAVLQNEPEMIKILLDNGANPSFVLHKAISEGQTQVIKKLIDIGANVSTLDSSFLTPLCLAIKINNVNAIIELVEQKVDLNVRCNPAKKEFPLHLAVSNDSIMSVKILVQGGAKTSVLNDNGLTPLVMAVFENKDEIIHVLMNTSNGVGYKVDRKGNTPLHLAVSTGDIYSTQKLIELGASVDTVNEEGFTPLCKASLTKKRNIISILQKNGANINFQTPFGDTPLHLAVINKCITAVVKLLELGAKLEYKNSKGFTPLCQAIMMNESNIINALLAKGANVNTKCNEFTPLLLAVSHSSLKTLVRLINLEASTTEDWISLSKKAVKADSPEILKYFIRKIKIVSGEFYGNMLFQAASSGSSRVIQELILLGVSVNIALSDGFTPLWNATIKNKIDTMKILIENGANLNRTVNYRRDGLYFHNWTLLHEAAFNGKVDAVVLLLKYGMNTEVKDGKEWTPLHYAAVQHNLPVVKTLIENGANVRAKTNQGELPVDLVKHRRAYKTDVIQWLTEGRV